MATTLPFASAGAGNGGGGISAGGGASEFGALDEYGPYSVPPSSGSAVPWDEQIVPALRKRLEEESARLGKRISRIESSDGGWAGSAVTTAATASGSGSGSVSGSGSGGYAKGAPRRSASRRERANVSEETSAWAEDGTGEHLQANTNGNRYGRAARGNQIGLGHPPSTATNGHQYDYRGGGGHSAQSSTSSSSFIPRPTGTGAEASSRARAVSSAQLDAGGNSYSSSVPSSVRLGAVSPPMGDQGTTAALTYARERRPPSPPLNASMAEATARARERARQLARDRSAGGASGAQAGAGRTYRSGSISSQQSHAGANGSGSLGRTASNAGRANANGRVALPSAGPAQVESSMDEDEPRLSTSSAARMRTQSSPHAYDPNYKAKARARAAQANAAAAAGVISDLPSTQTDRRTPSPTTSRLPQPVRTPSSRAKEAHEQRVAQSQRSASSLSARKDPGARNTPSPTHKKARQSFAAHGETSDGSDGDGERHAQNLTASASAGAFPSGAHRANSPPTQDEMDDFGPLGGLPRPAERYRTAPAGSSRGDSGSGSGSVGGNTTSTSYANTNPNAPGLVLPRSATVSPHSDSILATAPLPSSLSSSLAVMSSHPNPHASSHLHANASHGPNAGLYPNVNVNDWDEQLLPVVARRLEQQRLLASDPRLSRVEALIDTWDRDGLPLSKSQQSQVARIRREREEWAQQQREQAEEEQGAQDVEDALHAHAQRGLAIPDENLAPNDPRRKSQNSRRSATSLRASSHSAGQQSLDAPHQNDDPRLSISGSSGRANGSALAHGQAQGKGSETMQMQMHEMGAQQGQPMVVSLPEASKKGEDKGKKGEEEDGAGCCKCAIM